MTICLAALAENKNAIVCVADKALTYGPYIQWDADSGKVLKLNPSGSVVMLSDEGTGPRVLTSLFEKSGEIGGNKRADTIAACEEMYRAAVDNLVEGTFLRPRLLSRTDYVRAITSSDLNHMMRALADEIKDFDMKCDLLACGFDIDGVPFILDIGSPGIAKDMTLTGFQAIGGGWEKAISRLLFAEHKSAYPIERVLYECFDAKANAEMVPGVGYEWDAAVITKHGAHDVPQDIKRIIEQVWICKEQSPFDRDVDKDDVPPKKWKHILRTFSNGCLTPSASQVSAGTQ